MAKRTQWIPHFTTGNAMLDEQHRQLLAQYRQAVDVLTPLLHALADGTPEDVG